MTAIFKLCFSIIMVSKRPFFTQDRLSTNKVGNQPFLAEPYFCVHKEIISPLNTQNNVMSSEKSGVFSVKMAYNLAMSEQELTHSIGATSTRHGGEPSLWNYIWKDSVHHKM
jgi:hypothetical protein